MVKAPPVVSHYKSKDCVNLSSSTAFSRIILEKAVEDRNTIYEMLGDFMYKLYFSQKLPIDLLQAWDFFSSPANLEKITPKSLRIKIKHQHNEKKMYPGQIIAYSVAPLWNIPMEWITEITAVEKLSYFIDEQKIGPYAFWHHEHWFTQIPNGILMEDILYYKVPFGIFGKALHYLKIKKDLNEIFQHRSQILEKLFGPYQSKKIKHD